MTTTNNVSLPHLQIGSGVTRNPLNTLGIAAECDFCHSEVYLGQQLTQRVRVDRLDEVEIEARFHGPPAVGLEGLSRFVRDRMQLFSQARALAHELVLHFPD